MDNMIFSFLVLFPIIVHEISIFDYQLAFLRSILIMERKYIIAESNATQCSQLLSVVKDAFLDQIVSTPTRITEYTSNILDLFLTNNRTLVNKCEVVPRIGDHEAVYVESSMRPMKVKTPPRKVFQYKKANYDQMQEDLREYQTLFTETRSSSVNDTWIQFEEKLKELTDKHIPSKMITGNRIRKPWMDKTVRSGHRKVKKLFAKQKKSGRQKRPKEISSYQSPSSKARKASLLEVC